MPADTHDSETRLREEVATLAVDDILALCYTLQHRPARLRLYLDVLRTRGGERAQFAAALICFDLARQGDSVAQREFILLAASVRVLAAKQELIAALVGGDAYLSFLWELCAAQLSDLEHEPASSFAPDLTQPVVSLDLLSDADLGDFELVVDERELEDHLAEAVERFLGGELGMPVYDPQAGFRMSGRRDVDRIESFLQELDSLRDHVPRARGFRALTLLFYATHMRAKTLFGGVNERRRALLRAGLREFLVSGAEVAEIAGVLGPLHADADVWPRVVETLLSYLSWVNQRSDTDNV